MFVAALLIAAATLRFDCFASVVGVHLSYSSPGFQCLLDSAVYLPSGWADDPVRRKEIHIPNDAAGPQKHYPRLAALKRRCNEVQNLARYAPIL